MVIIRIAGETRKCWKNFQRKVHKMATTSVAASAYPPRCTRAPKKLVIGIRLIVGDLKKVLLIKGGADIYG